MDQVGNFWRGVILGIAIAAPVGPIGLLCIRRTLRHGALTGFAAGLGAALGDGLFGALAAFGFHILVDFLTGYQGALRAVGGVVMVAVAVQTLRIRPDEPVRAGEAGPWFSGFMTCVVLTLTNPLTVLGVMALFAGLGLGHQPTNLDAATLALGVFAGSALWWLMLSVGVSLIRHRVTDRLFHRLNQGTAFALFGFGAYALGGLLMR